MSASEPFQFEGAEKLLEIWFAPSSADVERPMPLPDDGKHGLRRVNRAVWEEMLEIVKCKILSVVEGSEIDAYLLRSVAPSTDCRSAMRLTPCSFSARIPCCLSISANHRYSSLPIVSSSKRAERLSISTVYLASLRSPAIMQI